MRYILAFIICFLANDYLVLGKNTITGQWTTIDDETGEPVQLLKYLRGMTISMEK